MRLDRDLSCSRDKHEGGVRLHANIKRMHERKCDEPVRTQVMKIPLERKGREGWEWEVRQNNLWIFSHSQGSELSYMDSRRWGREEDLRHYEPSNASRPRSEDDNYADGRLITDEKFWTCTLLPQYSVFLENSREISMQRLSAPPESALDTHFFKWLKRPIIVV